MAHEIQYQNWQKIGEGGFGVVYKAYDTLNDRFVAIKEINYFKLDDEQEKELLKEIEVLQKLTEQNIDNVVKFYGVYKDLDYYYIVQEFLDGKDLFTIIVDQYNDYETNKNKNFRLSMAKIYMKQLTKALIKIHELGVIHRDIKPENIMIVGNKPYLIDFGLSCFYEKKIYNNMSQKDCENCCLGTSGTIYYAAPEVLLYGNSYSSSDYWSLGVTLYYYIMGHFPFVEDVTDIRYAFVYIIDLYKNINKEIVNKEDLIRLLPGNSDVERAINGCMEFEPNARYNGTQILALLR